MDTELEIKGTTLTGGLDFNLAAAACYVPMAFIHFVVAILFLVAEPKEHRFVRFHAAQSLLLATVTVGGSLGSVVVGMVVLPLIVMMLSVLVGGALGAISEDLAGLVALIGMLISTVSYVGGAVLGIGLSLCFPVLMIGTAVWAASGSEAKLPILGRLAMRFV